MIDNDALEIIRDEDSSEDHIDLALAHLQSVLRAEKSELLAESMECAALNEHRRTAYRERCLEALACAQKPSLYPAVYKIIESFLRSGDCDLVFSGIACCSELPRAMRMELKPLIYSKMSSDDKHLARAAKFLYEELQ